MTQKVNHPEPTPISSVQAGGNGAGSLAGDVADVGEGQVVIVEQRDERLLFGRQVVDGPLQQFRPFVVGLLEERLHLRLGLGTDGFVLHRQRL